MKFPGQCYMRLEALCVRGKPCFSQRSDQLIVHLFQLPTVLQADLPQLGRFLPSGHKIPHVMKRQFQLRELYLVHRRFHIFQLIFRHFAEKCQRQMQIFLPAEIASSEFFQPALYLQQLIFCFLVKINGYK